MGFLSQITGGESLPFSQNLGAFGQYSNALSFGIDNAASDMVTGGAFSQMNAVNAQNAANAAQAQKQMDFQERMSNTSYQRATKDMVAAGINPMLAIMNGGASTPSGAMASMQAVPKGSVYSGLQSTAKQGFDMYQTSKLNSSTLDLNEANMDKAQSSAAESRANIDYLREQRRRVAAQADQEEVEAKVAKAKSPIRTKTAPSDALADSGSVQLILDFLRAFGSGGSGRGATNVYHYNNR